LGQPVGDALTGVYACRKMQDKANDLDASSLRCCSRKGMSIRSAHRVLGCPNQSVWTDGLPTHAPPARPKYKGWIHPIQPIRSSNLENICVCTDSTWTTRVSARWPSGPACKWTTKKKYSRIEGVYIN
jgi:hypothetical protein